MVLHSGRAAVLLGVSVLVIAAQGAAQQEAGKQPEPAATGLGRPLQELQRELDGLRAAGKTKEAAALERQAEQALSTLLLQFRQAQTQAIQQQDPAAHRLTEAHRLIEQVRTEVGQEAAEPLAKRLAAIEQSLQEGKTLAASDVEADGGEPEVHVLRINAGVALPDEFTEGRDHRTVGYASFSRSTAP